MSLTTKLRYVLIWLDFRAALGTQEGLASRTDHESMVILPNCECYESTKTGQCLTTISTTWVVIFSYLAPSHLLISSNTRRTQLCEKKKQSSSQWLYGNPIPHVRRQLSTKCPTSPWELLLDAHEHQNEQLSLKVAGKWAAQFTGAERIENKSAWDGSRTPELGTEYGWYGALCLKVQPKKRQIRGFSTFSTLLGKNVNFFLQNATNYWKS